MTLRILWLKSELLHPVDKGARILTYQVLKHLKSEHEITYLSFVRPHDPPASFALAVEYCHRLVPVTLREAEKFGARFYLELGLNLFSRLPYALQKYVSAEMSRAVGRELRARRYDLVVCDSLPLGVNFKPEGRTPAVLFQHNVESVIWERHAAAARGAIRRAYFRAQWRRMRAYERAACRRFDAVIAVSEVDRDLLREFGARHVYAMPAGVDTDYFAPDEGAQRAPHGLVFTGSMDWLPNEDGVVWFVERVLPQVRLAVPGVTLTVVGRSPSPKLAALARREPSVVVTGRVEDVRPYVNRAAACVVPIRIGGGVRLKIFEAMAMGRPVISTTVGAEGLPVRDGVDVLLADSPDEFAAATVRALTDEPFARELGRRARARVQAAHSWRGVADHFADACRRVARRREPGRA
jgi:polysaccharide biosynthesis protein PslH